MHKAQLFWLKELFLLSSTCQSARLKGCCTLHHPVFTYVFK